MSKNYHLAKFEPKFELGKVTDFHVHFSIQHSAFSIQHYLELP